MAKKKVSYNIEREFLKKYEIRESVELIIARYIQSGEEGRTPDHTVASVVKKW